jgi:hypothetical protein
MNDLNHDADEFWGDQADWRSATPNRSKAPRAARPSGGGLAARLRTGVNAVLDAGSGATREHKRVDAGRVPPASAAGATSPTRRRAVGEDPTPVMAQRDLLDGWPDDDVDDVPPRSGRVGARSPGAAAPGTGDDEPELAYGHDDLSYAGLGDLADDGPVGEPTPADGAASRVAGGLAATGRTVRVRGDRARRDGGPAADEPEWGAGWEPVTATPERSAGGVDPKLARFGVIAVAVTLLVPVVMGLRSDDGGGVATEDVPSTVDETTSEATSGGQVTPTTVVVGETTATTRAAETTESGSGATGATGTAASGESVASASSASADAGSAGDAANAADADDAVETASVAVEPEPATTAPVCAASYEVVDGDYWLRLADGAGVPLADLLAVNSASSDTALFPGSTICLPIGASTPPPPPAPTTAPPTTAAPTTAAPTTAAPTTAAPTTAAPTTAAPATAAPTTQAPDPPPSYTSGQVQQIIRDVFPDHLEERALVIADRESNFVPTAKNYCCYGLFQIYWTVHRGWLSELGITSDQQLFDAETNARAALALYRRSGGWGPWGF